MDDKKWERWGLLGGIEGVVLILIAAFMAGTPPDSDAGSAEVAEWYVDNDAAIQISALLVGLAVIALAWWFGSVWRHMRRAEGGEPRLSLIAATGFIFSGTMAMVALALNSGVAMRIDEVGGAASVFRSVTNALLGFSSLGDVILIAAVSVLAMRTEFLPKWLWQSGMVTALINVVGSITVATDNTGIAFIGFIGFLLWLLWIASVAVVLYQKTETPAAA
jgi:hypothetical protein